MPLSAILIDAARKTLRAARQSLPAMLALQAAMALVVAAYYFWPAATHALSRLAVRQHSGGVLAAGCASALAGGLLSELSTVYFQDDGRWTRAHLENAAFKMVLFFVSGAIVFEFYAQQAVWFGNGTAWSILVPKILVDQFLYTPIWSVPFQTTVTRWHDLHYSVPRLRQEWNVRSVTERMLPVLFMNWLFWLPGVIFIYAMPQNLQMPLAIFANAIWGVLLPAAARVNARHPTGTVQDLLPPPREAVALK